MIILVAIMATLAFLYALYVHWLMIGVYKALIEEAKDIAMLAKVVQSLKSKRDV